MHKILIIKCFHFFEYERFLVNGIVIHILAFELLVNQGIGYLPIL
ncbi:MAG: hypothetical protein RLZ56_328 [Bacteroidota bacterium]|jgi:hypothetical protein